MRIMEIAKRLKDHDYDTLVVMPKDETIYNGLLERSAIENVQINIQRFQKQKLISSTLTWCIYFWPTVFALVRQIKKNSVKLVHCNGLLNIQPAVAAKLSGAKLLWHLNDTVIPRNVCRILKPFAKLIADKIVIAANGLGEHYSLNSEDCFVLYAPVDTKHFSPAPIEKPRLKSKLGFNSSEKVVGTVANINPLKGYEYLLEMARLVKKNMDGVKFVAAGKILESNRPYWEKVTNLRSKLLLEDDFLFLGARNDVSEILCSIDVFVLSSVSEACPIAVLEAMSMEKPVVATDVGGVSELVEDGVSGFLIPPGDPEALAEKVEYLLKNPKKAEEFGKKGREKAVRYFDIDVCVKKHKQLYDDLITC